MQRELRITSTLVETHPDSWGLTTVSADPVAEGYRFLWGKWGADNPSDLHQPVHPLICHLIDVAAVAAAMWRECLPRPVRADLTDALGLPDERAAEAWVALLAGSHDLGKASRAFSLKQPRAVPVLKRGGLYTDPLGEAPPHGWLTARLFPTVLAAVAPASARHDPVVRELAQVVGGHHGTFPTAVDMSRVPHREVDSRSWTTARQDLIATLARLHGVPLEAPPSRLSRAAALYLAGLVSVADWLGSNTDYFPYAARLSTLGEAPADLADYAANASKQARTVLADLHWRLPALAGSAPGNSRFRALFDFDPLPLQASLAQLAEGLDGPALAIVEAPMGEGKTEAALYLAHHWLERGTAQGVYVALPTQATSNQMFGRVARFLRAACTDAAIELQLLHGHASLSAEFAVLRQAGQRLYAVREIHDEPTRAAVPPHVVASEWFTYRKRGLLAPFGVGTVDQALLGALPTRHVFVRLFGLARKVVVLDEVHAYDTYTSTLLGRLLRWLGALGAPVVLLSATLPSSRRADLAREYATGAGWDAAPPPAAAYPAVTLVQRSGTTVHPVDTSVRARRQSVLEWVEGGLSPEAASGTAPFPLGERLAYTLREGGCAVVICNTVARAQQTYTALRRYFGRVAADGSYQPDLADDGEPVLDLLHARFTFDERERREQRALRRFGKPGGTVACEGGESRPVRRPSRAVLVATQVVEQSLDLDFDLMVSDLAPVDLVLQRIGRLHRHPGRTRPSAVELPALWLLEPAADGEGGPRFDAGSVWVYGEHLLLRSWLQLQRRSALRVPDDVSGLVEAVYGDDAPLPTEPAWLAARWKRSREALLKQVTADEMQARLRHLALPHPNVPLEQLTAQPQEEDDSQQLHRAFQALTRLGPPSVTTVVLHGSPQRPTLDGAGQQPVSRRPELDDVRRLLRRSVSVSRYGLTEALLGQSLPAGWADVPLLSHCRAIFIGPDGWARVPGFRLRLDESLGLVVESDSITEGGKS